MRFSRKFEKALWAAVFSLALPLGQAQAQAQECVEFSGLRHCGIGDARLSVTDEGLRVDNESGSGQDGMVIHTGLATSWTAGIFGKSDHPDSERTVFSSVSEGSTTSTASLVTEGEKTSYAASFTGAGESTTYSVMIYYQGQLQRAIGGVGNGTIGVHEPGPRTNPGSVQPYCRARHYDSGGRTGAQAERACMNDCVSMGYNTCSYCTRPCTATFNTRPNASCEWRFDVAYPYLELADGSEVLGDQIVLSEEVRGPASYPYLGFDEIHIQSTMKAMQIVSESVVSACMK